jgi:hypothetical protein
MMLIISMVMLRLERLEAMWPGLFLLEAGALPDGGQAQEVDKGQPLLYEVGGHSPDGEVRGRSLDGGHPLKGEVSGLPLEEEVRGHNLKEVRGHHQEDEIRGHNLKEVRGHPLENEVRGQKLDQTELSLLQQIIMARTGGWFKGNSLFINSLILSIPGRGLVTHFICNYKVISDSGFFLFVDQGQA